MVLLDPLEIGITRLCVCVCVCGQGVRLLYSQAVDACMAPTPLSEDVMWQVPK